MLEKCPNCGKRHIFKPKVCECGHDFEEELKIFCPKDKTELKLEWAECPTCKTPLNDLLKYPCPKCKKMVGVKDKFCACGEQLIFQVIDCPYCKKEIDARSTVCPKCGKNLYEEEGGHGGEEYAPDEYHCPRCGCRLAHATAECPVCDQQHYSYDDG